MENPWKTHGQNHKNLRLSIMAPLLAPHTAVPSLRKESLTDQNTAPALGSPSSTMMLERGSCKTKGTLLVDEV